MSSYSERRARTPSRTIRLSSARNTRIRSPDMRISRPRRRRSGKGVPTPLPDRRRRGLLMRMSGERIRVFLADDNLIVREGVRALLSLYEDIELVGVASDYDELVQGAGSAAPQ